MICRISIIPKNQLENTDNAPSRHAIYFARDRPLQSQRAFHYLPAAMSPNRLRHCPTIVGKAKRCDNSSAQSPIFRRKDSLAINSVRASAIFFSSPTGLTRIPLSWSLMISEGPLSQLNDTWGTAQVKNHSYSQLRLSKKLTRTFFQSRYLCGSGKRPMERILSNTPLLIPCTFHWLRCLNIL